MTNEWDSVADEEDFAEEDFPTQNDIGPTDLDDGFSIALPSRERDVDEDTEGDDVVEIDSTDPLTPEEQPDARPPRAGSDEEELPVDTVIRTGKTSVSIAPQE